MSLCIASHYSVMKTECFLQNKLWFAANTALLWHSAHYSDINGAVYRECGGGTGVVGGYGQEIHTTDYVGTLEQIWYILDNVL